MVTNKVMVLLAMLVASAANTQTIQTAPLTQPTPAKPGWMCMADVDAGGTRLHGWRELEADGKFVREGADWVELPEKQLVKDVFVSIKWGDEKQRKLKFGQGKFDFVVMLPRSVDWPDEFRMVGNDPNHMGAFQAYGSSGRSPDQLVSHFRVSDWKAIAGKDRFFMWSFLGKHKLLVAGIYPNSALQDVEAKWPMLIPLLDTAAKDFPNRCKAINRI